MNVRLWIYVRSLLDEGKTLYKSCVEALKIREGQCLGLHLCLFDEVYIDFVDSEGTETEEGTPTMS